MSTKDGLKAVVIPMVTSSFVLGSCAQAGTLDGWNGFLAGFNIMVFLVATAILAYLISEMD